MTTPTTAEERAARLSECPSCTVTLEADGGRTHEPDCWDSRLIADVERLEAERDEATRLCGESADECDTHQVARARAEAERDTLANVMRNVAAPLERGIFTSDGPKLAAKLRHALAGLSTVTPADWAGHQQEESAGKTVEELREKYGLCERGSVCCQGDWKHYDTETRCFMCAQVTKLVCTRHGCDWPDEGECPEKEKVG